MPVYITLTKKKLTKEQKQSMVRRITDVHCEVTGAPSNYVTVLFFSGYVLKNSKKAMLMGSIRMGGTRTSEVIERLRNELLRGLESTLEMKTSEVGLEFLGVQSHWVYEGQQVLPKPGKEHTQKSQVASKKVAREADFLT